MFRFPFCNAVRVRAVHVCVCVCMCLCVSVHMCVHVCVCVCMCVVCVRVACVLPFQTTAEDFGLVPFIIFVLEFVQYYS